jgi:methylated-DNA-[protein]-cysteine S-methyltransferase
VKRSLELGYLRLIYTYVDTPIGAILIAGDETAIVEIHFAGAEPQPDWTRHPAALREAANQLRAYFAGERQTFDLPLAPRGTEFQQSVWAALQKIPYGETTTYSPSPNESDDQPPSTPSAPRTARIRSRSSSPATASSALADR